MTDAADAIVEALRSQPVPVGGWTMPDLRRAAGVSVGHFAAAVMQLRKEGKVHPYDLALARSMWPVDTAPQDSAPKDSPAPTLAEEVAAEARAAAANRHRAGIGGPNQSRTMPSIGAQLQERALEGAPQMAASILRDRWGRTWHRLCRHAQANGQKPVTAMIALLEKGMEGETAA